MVRFGPGGAAKGFGVFPFCWFMCLFWRVFGVFPCFSCLFFVCFFNVLHGLASLVLFWIGTCFCVFFRGF